VIVRAFDAPEGLVLEVEDHGPGVPSGLGERVFERLVQGAQDRGGVGLGLATVRRLAEAHGGRVELCAGPDRGAIFRVVLPCVPEVAVHPESP
jgi:signal transduction histidine kinase